MTCSRPQIRLAPLTVALAYALFAGGCSDPVAGGTAVDAGDSNDSTLSDGPQGDARTDATGALLADAETGAQRLDSAADSAASDSGSDAWGADAGTVTIPRLDGAAPAQFAFGQNYWDWVDFSHDGVTGLSGTETLVGALRLGVIRAGGINNDTNSPQPFDPTQIDKYVAYCRTVGAEPILQVPLVANSVDGGATSAQTAADMVTYANVTKNYGIKYWEIGNEPDNYDTTYDAGVPLNATDYCTAFASYAAAMRSANAQAVGAQPLVLLGPELAWQYISGRDWLTPFLDACKNDVDVVSIHRYPFSGAQLTTAGALGDDARFRRDLAAVGAIVQGHARPGTPLAVTEANVSYDYAQNKYTDAGALTQPGTFNAALWTADAIGVALQNNLWTLAMWNIGERSGGSVLGFIVDARPTPQYYASKLFSANLRGSVVTPAGVPAGFSVYGSYDPTGASTAVVVINKTSSPRSLTLSLDALAPHSFNFPSLSLSLVQIPDAPGGATHVVQYTPAMAAAGIAPLW